MAPCRELEAYLEPESIALCRELVGQDAPKPSKTKLLGCLGPTGPHGGPHGGPGRHTPPGVPVTSDEARWPLSHDEARWPLLHCFWGPWLSGLDFQRFDIVLYSAQLLFLCLGHGFCRKIHLGKHNDFLRTFLIFLKNPSDPDGIRWIFVEKPCKSLCFPISAKVPTTYSLTYWLLLSH